jgi:hypothetical protein
MAQDPSKAAKKEFRIENLDVSVTLRRLRVVDKVEVGLRQSALLRGAIATTLNPEAQELSYLLSCLKVAAVDKPDDFSFDDLDEEDLVNLWKEWDEWTKSFRNTRPANVE